MLINIIVSNIRIKTAQGANDVKIKGASAPFFTVSINTNIITTIGA